MFYGFIATHKMYANDYFFMEIMSNIRYYITMDARAYIERIIIFNSSEALKASLVKPD